MIAAVSRKMRCVVLLDGRVASFTSYYDANGDECEFDRAVSAVAEHPDGNGWFAIALDDWDEQTIH